MLPFIRLAEDNDVGAASALTVAAPVSVTLLMFPGLAENEGNIKHRPHSVVQSSPIYQQPHIIS